MSTKTSHFMKVLHFIATSRQKCVSEDQLKELLGNPSRSTWHRNVNELTEGTAEVPAFLLETVDKESGETNYCFNHQGWQAFIDAHTEGKFLLECYRQTGYLLDSDFANMVFELPDVERKSTESLSRKFLHLVKVRAHKTEHSKHVLDTLIQSLISQKQVEITYEGSTRILRPYTLLSHRDELYIMGERKKDGSLWEERMFKLSRITNIKMLTIGFPYPEKRQWDPEKKFLESSGLMIDEIRRVTIKVYGHSRKILSEKEFFNGSLSNQDSESDTYNVTYSHPNEFLGQLFVYAQDIEIVDDEELQSMFVEKARQAISRNTHAGKKLA